MWDTNDYFMIYHMQGAIELIMDKIHSQKIPTIQQGEPYSIAILSNLAQTKRNINQLVNLGHIALNPVDIC